ncbi:MAG TPA: hypothetical protein VFT82_01680 [Candidatus Paceibacterota bacterium]|nr:hypothetical protein [Candidatus Paceibacterota bacterium]
MAFSGLKCPKCSGDLFDGATSCHRCHAPIGKKELRRALANEFLDAHKNDGTIRLLFRSMRFWFGLRVIKTRLFVRRVNASIRRRIAYSFI